jgi:hypothetical protein
MKTTVTLMLALVCLGMFTACTKEKREPIEVYFYTTQTSETQDLTLIIDGKEMGELPTAQLTPDCGNVETLAGLLKVEVSQGRHCFMAENAEGETQVHGWFKCTRDETGMELRTGPGEDPKGGALLESKTACDVATMGLFN